MPLFAQAKAASSDDVPQTVTNAVSVERIDALRKQVEEANLDAELKKKIQETLQQAADELKRADELDTVTAANKAKVESLQDRLNKRKAELETPDAPSLDDVPAEPSLTDLEAAMAKRRTSLQEAKTALADRETEPATRAERRKQVLALNASHAERRSAIEGQLQTPDPVG